MAEWGSLEKQFREEGYSEADILQAKDSLKSRLRDEGYAAKELNTFFGDKTKDPTPLQQFVRANLKKAYEEKQAKKEEIAKSQNPADSFLDAIEAGFQMSTGGLITRGKLPDTVLPENAPMAYRIGAQLGTVVGDIPAMVVGGAAGTVGGPVGVGAGAFAFPAGLRSLLMDYYERGEVDSFVDFWDMASGAMIEASKGAVVGGATALTGSLAGTSAKAILSGTAQKIATPIAERSVEIATMTTVGSALEGEVPEPSDFVEAAIVIGAFTGVAKVANPVAKTVASKLRKIYAKTGLKPEQIIDQATKDASLRGELLSANVEVPPRLLPRTESLEAIKVPEFKAPEKAMSEAEKAVASQIEFQTPKKQTDIKATFDDLYTKYVDDLNPLKILEQELTGKKELASASQSPYKLARLTRGDFGQADLIVRNELKPILDPFKGELENFETFAVAKRAIELADRGIKTGIDIEQAKAVVKEKGAKYSEAFKKLVDLQDSMIERLVDAGVVSSELAQKMRELNQSYVPFYRIMEEDFGKGAGSGLKVKQPIKRIKGSEKKIAPPLESVIKNIYAYTQLANRNMALLKLTELAKNNPEAAKGVIEKVPTKMRPIKVSEPEIAKFFEEHGIDAPAEILSVFRPQKTGLAPDEIAVFNKGKREVYKVPKEVAGAIKNLDQESIGILVKVLSIPAKSLRAGVTLVPEFTARNFIRDQLTGHVFSQEGFVPAWDALKGIGSIVSKDQAYQNWLNNGGGNAAVVSLDRNYLKNDIFKLSKDASLLEQSWNVVKSPLELARVASEIVEASSRVGVYKKAIEKGLEPKEAAFRSREATLDFARMGSKMRALNMMTAFLNVSVQGVDRTARAFKENPKSTSIKVLTGITLPSVLLWWANKDDPRMKEIPRWQKDLFWILPTDKWEDAPGFTGPMPEGLERFVNGKRQINNGVIYRIPKPFELGIIFGSLPERVLEAFFTDNPKAFDDFTETLVSAFSPSVVPTIAVPMIETFANRSIFLDRPVVPYGTEELLPEYQYSEYTSDAAKLLGRFAAQVPGGKFSKAASPAIIENFIRGWTGGTGQYALKIADDLLIKAGVVPDPVKPISTLADIPIIKGFVVRYPSAGAQSIQDFYDEVSRREVIFNTIKELAKRGEAELVERELEQLGVKDNPAKLVTLSQMKSALSNLNKIVRMTYKNPDIKPEEKRQLIDGYYYTMVQIAKQGNKVFLELEKQGNQTNRGFRELQKQGDEQ